MNSALARVLESRKVWIAIVATAVVVATQLGCSAEKAAIIGGAVLKLAFVLIGAIGVEDAAHKAFGFFDDNVDKVKADRITKVLTEQAVKAEDPEQGSQKSEVGSQKGDGVGEAGLLPAMLIWAALAGGALAAICMASGCTPQSAEKTVYAARAGYNAAASQYLGALQAHKLSVATIDRIEPLRKTADAVLTQLETDVRAGVSPSKDLLNTLNAAVAAFATAAQEAGHASPATRPSSNAAPAAPGGAGDPARVAAADARAVGRTRCPDPFSQRGDRAGRGGGAGAGGGRGAGGVAGLTIVRGQMAGYRSIAA